MLSRLLFRDAQGRDGAVDLRTEPVYVGRAVECAVRTDDAMVSRRHSLVTWVDGHYWIEDLGSSNGTHVNDVRVQRQALHHNDVVRCGSLWLRYVEQAAQPAQAVSAPPVPTPPPAVLAGSGTPFAPTPFVPSVPTPAPVRTISIRPGASVGGKTSSDLEATSGGQVMNEEVMALRHERDEAVAENRRLKDDLGRRVQVLMTDVERVREELGQLARELGVKPRS